MLISDTHFHQLLNTENTSFFQTIVDESMDATFITDSELQVIYNNRACTELLTQTMTGKPLRSFWHDGNQETYDHIVDRIQMSGFLSSVRIEGFHRIVDQFPGIHVVDQVACAGNRDHAYNETLRLLEEHKPGTLDVVWTTSGDMALGAILAIQEKQRQDDVKVVSNDGTVETLEKIHNGQLAAVTYHGFPELGWYAAQFAIQLGLGQAVPDAFEIHPQTIYEGNCQSSGMHSTPNPIDWESIQATCPSPATIEIGWIDGTGVVDYHIAREFAQKATEDANQHGILVNMMSATIDWQDDIEDQIAIVDDFIQKRVDVIIVATNASEATRLKLREATDQGIRIIFLNQPESITDVDVACYIGIDNIETGMLSGYAVLNCLGSRGPLNDNLPIDTDSSSVWDVNAWQKLYESTNPPLDNIAGRIAILDGFSGNWRGECHLRDANDAPLFMDTTIQFIYDQRGQFRGLLGTSRDISERKAAEEEAREHSNHYRVISELMSDTAFAHKYIEGEGFVPEWIIGSTMDKLGFTHDEWYTTAKQEGVFHPDDLDSLLADVSATQEGIPTSGEYRTVMRNGDVHWVQITRLPIWDKNQQQVVRYYGVTQDITARKVAEDALREREEWYRAISELMSDSAFSMIYDPLSKSYSLERFMGQNVTGYATDNVTEKDIIAISYPDDRDRIIQAFKQVKQGESSQNKFRVIAKNGEVKWLLVKFTPAQITHEGFVQRFYCAYQDITEETLATQELFQSEERLQQATRAGNIGIFDHNHANDEMYWSQQQREIYGWRPDEEVGLEKFIAHVHPEDIEWVDKAVAKAHDPKGDGLFDSLHRIIDAQGKTRWITTRSKTFFAGDGDERKPVRTVGAMIDVTERKEIEESLSLASFTIQHASDPIYWVDVSAKIIDANLAAGDMLGYTQAELLSMTIDEIDPQLTYEQWVDNWSHMDVFERQSLETFHTTKDGRSIPVEVVGDYFIFYERALVCIFVRDITERKQAEAKLRESETLYRRLSEMMTDSAFMYEYNEETDSYYHKSLIGTRVTGYTDEELTKLDLGEFYHRDDVARVRADLGKTLQGDYSEGEYRVFTKNNDLKWVAIKRYPEWDDINQRLARYYGMTTDITQRKEAELALYTSEERYRSLFEYSHDPIIVMDESGTMITVNQRAAEFLEYERDDLIGQHYRIFAEGPELDDAYQKWNSALSGTYVPPYERVIKIKSGAYRFVEISLSRLIDNTDGTTFVQSIIRDITDKKRAKDALQQSEARLRQAVSAGNIGIFDIDHTTGEFYWSPEQYDIWGESPDNPITIDVISSRTHPDDREKVTNAFKPILDPRSDHRESYLIELEHRIIVENGKVFWLNMRAEHIFSRVDDAPVHVRTIGATMDITERKQAEQRLRNDEERFRKLLGATFEAIMVHEKGTILHVNPAFEELFGYSLDKAIGMKATDLHPGKYKALVASRIHSTDSADAEQMLGIKRDGTVFEIIVQARVIDYLGQTVRLVAFRDISEQIKAQRRIQESESMLQIILNTIPVRVFWKDRDGRLLGCNQPFAEDANADSPDDLIGSNDDDFVSNNLELPEVSELLMSYRADDLEVIESGIPKLGYEESQIRADGEHYWLRTSKLPLRNIDGEIIGVLGVYEDITKQKRANAVIRENENWYRNISELVTIAFSWKYDEDKNDWVIERTIGSFVSDRDESTLSNFDSLVERTHPDDLPRLMADIAATIEGEETAGEYRLLTTTGEVRWVYIKRKPEWDEKKQRVIRYFASTEDITERKKAEEEIYKLNSELEHRVALRTHQLEVANRELESFAYSVSHDLRAPLRSIAGFSQALYEDYFDQLGDDGKDFLQRIRKATLRMSTLIDDMLQLSRVTQRPLNFEDVNLSHIVQDIATELETLHPDRKITWNIMPDVIDEGDSGLLRIALDNLLRNAHKFTAKHDRALIEFGYEENDKGRVYFVRDDGAGFDMTYIDKLFVTFQRLHTASEFEGTGVGLAIVQRIIRRHGGEIRAESVVDEGATFYFTLSPEI